ncbi:TspO/MBR family protein, partial [Acinetobacter baumannii]
QLFLNFSWSIVFFRYDAIQMALLIIILLVVAVVCMIKVFQKQNEFSAHLLLPYLIWLLFATYLNLGIVVLN